MKKVETGKPMYCLVLRITVCRKELDHLMDQAFGEARNAKICLDSLKSVVDAIHYATSSMSKRFIVTDRDFLVAASLCNESLPRKEAVLDVDMSNASQLLVMKKMIDGKIDCVDDTPGVEIQINGEVRMIRYYDGNFIFTDQKLNEEVELAGARLRESETKEIRTGGD